MADISRHLSLPFILPAQAQKHVTHNEAISQLDVLTQLSVESRDLQSPPSNLLDGAQFIVAANPQAEWAGRTNDIAVFENGAWRFVSPKAGWRAYVAALEGISIYDGTAWKDLALTEFSEIEAFALGMSVQPQSAFSAKLNAALWTALYQADGGDGNLLTTLNKETEAADAGFVFQQDFETRAFIGVFGDNRLRLATSANGTDFHDGIVIEPDTGSVSQPNLPKFKGTSNFDNYVPADTWTQIAINTAEFNGQQVFDPSTNVFTAPEAGTYTFGATLTFKENVSAGVQMGARFRLNGVSTVTGSTSEITGLHVSEQTSIQIQALVSLSKSDTVELQGKLRGADGYFQAEGSVFWGYKVG